MAQGLFSKTLKLFEGELGEAIVQAIRQIGKFTGKRKINVFEWDEHRIAISIQINVELPPRGNYEGIDIQKVEPVIIVFNKTSYPGTAPRAHSDRLDFPSDKLSHLYVAKNGRPNPLCLIRGDIDEWFANKEPRDLILQIQSWYSDAASGSLVEDGDQFDPIRLEGYRGSCNYKHQELSNVVCTNKSLFANSNFALALFSETEKQTEKNYPSFRLEKLIESTEEFGEAFVNSIKALVEDLKGITKQRLTFGLIVWSREQTINRQYYVSLPKKRSELVSLCEKSNIQLDQALNFFFGKPRLDILNEVPILIGIKRPKTLIGYSSDIEFLNFYLTIASGDVVEGKIVNDIPVSFQNHNEPLSIDKAREISGYKNDLGKILIVGNGALGSKVSMHLLRSGHVDMMVLDDDKLSPHNLVRHALLPESVGKSKVTALKEIAKSLYKHDNVQSMMEAVPVTGEVIFGEATSGLINDYKWLFDFTASRAYQNSLVMKNMPPTIKICKASIVDQGNLGVMLIEGKNRNPRIDDLQILTYDMYKHNKAVAKFVADEFQRSKVSKARINVGVGCNSETTIISDDIISIHASVFTAFIKNDAHKFSQGENGLIYLSSVEKEDGFGVLANANLIEPLTTLRHGKWEIRIKNGLDRILKSEMGKAMPHETGGVFVGVINKKTKCIHVTDIIFAPPDSKANEVCFFRGVDGLPEEIDKVKSQSGNTFGYIGEWHTHPFGPNGMSGTDLRTVRRFHKEFEQLENPMPVFLMIITPVALLPFVFD